PLLVDKLFEHTGKSSTGFSRMGVAVCTVTTASRICAMHTTPRMPGRGHVDGCAAAPLARVGYHRAMLALDADQTRDALPFEPLIDALRERFRSSTCVKLTSNPVTKQSKPTQN
ncbi:hypothetical protein RZS08_27880, partial [Arthrospira platensis SPKY1]|nr:hypothetical protein [Arthrospira platensis SPKY1]